MGVNHTFQQYTEKILNDGGKTLFWEDSWVNNTPLAVQFPRLYNVTFSRFITVADLKREGWGYIRFRRTLFGETAAQLTQMQALVDVVQLNDELDRVKWKIVSSGNFQVKSLFLSLRARGVFP